MCANGVLWVDTTNVCVYRGSALLAFLAVDWLDDPPIVTKWGTQGWLRTNCTGRRKAIVRLF